MPEPCGNLQTQPDKRGATSAAGCPGCVDCQPRYTVELTTEGWQIRDNMRFGAKSTLTAEVFGSEHAARREAYAWNTKGRP